MNIKVILPAILLVLLTGCTANNAVETADDHRVGVGSFGHDCRYDRVLRFPSLLIERALAQCELHAVEAKEQDPHRQHNAKQEPAPADFAARGRSCRTRATVRA